MDFDGPRLGAHAGERGQDSYLSEESFQLDPSKLSRFSPTCKATVLSRLGWKIEVNPNATTPSSKTDGVCEAISTQDIKNRVLLTLELPWSVNASEHPEEIRNALDQALQSAASVCAYAQSYIPALTRATHRLYRNHLYMFNTFLGEGIVRLDDALGWKRISCTDQEKCFTPAEGETSRALRSLYWSPIASECGTGVQLAEYATLRELFGTEGVKNYFDPEEIFVGTWQDIERSDSVIHGNTGRRFKSENGMAYSRMGSKALIGVPGYVGSLFDESHLDDLTNRNENFVVVDATANGARALLQKGGLSSYLDHLKQVWRLTRKMNAKELRGLQKMAELGELAHCDTPTLLKRMEVQWPYDDPSPQACEVARLLSDPFLNETQIYVHPVGVRSFSWHILRLARVNSRTPYGISFYAEATHGEIFDRWILQQLDNCE